MKRVWRWNITSSGDREGGDPAISRQQRPACTPEKMPEPMGSPGNAVLKGHKSKIARLPDFVVAEETQFDLSRCGHLPRLEVCIPSPQGHTPSDRMLPSVIGGPGGEGIYQLRIRHSAERNLQIVARIVARRRLLPSFAGFLICAKPLILFGSPSWTRIELCVSPPGRPLGRFWVTG